MEIRLDGKVMLVSGSTQGLGAKIAALAVASGVAAVMISGRDEARGREMVARLAGQGAEIAFTAVDLQHAEGPARLAEATVQAFGRIDLMVNSAGLTDRASMLDGTLEVWERLFAVNARAPYFLMQAAIQDMLSREAAGSIVNILSMNAHCGSPELAIYSASKGALSTLTRNAANACLARRIRVNGINMGWAPTAGEQVMQGRTLGKGEDWAVRAAEGLPLKRMLSDDEVAGLAIYMLSDSSGLLTGVPGRFRADRDRRACQRGDSLMALRPRLGRSTVDRLPADVQRPAYDRGQRQMRGHVVAVASHEHLLAGREEQLDALPCVGDEASPRASRLEDARRRRKADRRHRVARDIQHRRRRAIEGVVVGRIDVAVVADVGRYCLGLPSRAADQEAACGRDLGRREEELLDASLAVGQPIAEEGEVAGEAWVGCDGK